MSRLRVTLRRDAPRRVEMRGYFDGNLDELADFASALQPFDILVIGSFADDDYDPFQTQQ